MCRSRDVNLAIIEMFGRGYPACFGNRTTREFESHHLDQSFDAAKFKPEADDKARIWSAYHIAGMFLDRANSLPLLEICSTDVQRLACQPSKLNVWVRIPCIAPLIF